ncbi:MAG: hypothetical protein K8L97_28410 [Anaerolineae bacterium]|nr:hypothetical protein [Anaerolineae bacterium]
MPTNRAFWRALNALAHPISIVAVITLLFNDHWLRWNHPSWLTGKLGDFTWLIFAPFVAGLLFSWLIPRRIQQHERILGIVSITIIGLWFALAKTVPLVHGLTTTAWENIVGWQGTLRMDATDLFTLPALWISWQIWNCVPNTALNLRPIGYVIFGLAIVSTLANSPPPIDLGIHCVLKSDNQLFAISIYSYGQRIFSSDDGGLSWRSYTRERPLEIDQICSLEDQTGFEIPNSTIQYRWQPDERIEQSLDDGNSWTTVYDLIENRQEVREEYHQFKSASDYSPSVIIAPTPLSALFDPDSGNMLFAMGWNGILLKTSAGEWKWVAVGSYRLDDIYRFDQVPSILFFQLILAAILILLVLVTFATYIQENRWNVQEYLVSICWIAWMWPLVATMSIFDFYQNTFLIIVVLITISCGLLMTFVLTIASIPVFWRYRKELKIALLIGLIAAFLYLFPLIIWTQGTIPRYSTAATFSFLLVISGALAGFHHYQRLYPPKKKKKAEELVER